MKKFQSDSQRDLALSRRSIVLGSAIAAAISTFALLAPPAMAQQRVGSDGRLIDASNRVGSGGLNDNSASSLPPGVFGNALVNRDVTGGKGFQGAVPYFDPGAFHGILPGQGVSDFVSQSTNVQTNGTIINNAQNVHLFLGDNRGVNPPSNFISTGAQPGYIPAAPISDSTTGFTSDARLGNPAATTPLTSSLPTSIFQTGGTQAGGQSTYVTNSALFGQKSLQSSQQNNGQLGTSNSSALGAGPLGSSLGSGDRIDLSAETRLQSINDTQNSDLSPTSDSGLAALGTGAGISSYPTPHANGLTGTNGGPNALASQQASSAGSPTQNANATVGNNGANGPLGNGGLNGQPNGGTGINGAGQNGSNNGQANGQIGGSAVSAAVPSGYALNANVGGSALSSGLNTGEGNSTNIYSPTSNLPGSQYMRMVQRLKSINGNAPLNPVERNLLEQAKFQDVKAAQANNAPKQGPRNSPSDAKPGMPAGGNGSDVAPPGLGQPGAGLTGTTPRTGALIPQQLSPSSDKNKPVAVKSFADDEASSGTREMMSKAEDLMKQGKFTSALEQYDLVEQQSPSQPFVQLARANAELGASYYGLAEAHLRQAFMSDQALLSAQLDLKSLLGQDKLQYLTKDLKQIAQTNPTESRPVFLLAYICYNTNQERGAAAYLDLAEKREGKADPFFKLLRQHWDLPSVGDSKGDSDLNK